jgi:cytochrome c-type biogenesis protein CcmH/NrfG
LKRRWGTIRVVLAGAVCVTAVFLTRRAHDTVMTEVYDPYCKGVSASDPNDRIRWLTIAAEADPGLARTYKDRGLAYFERGDMDRAIHDYGRAIALNPGYIEAYNARAIVCYLRKDFQKMSADMATIRRLGGKVDPRLPNPDPIKH